MCDRCGCAAQTPRTSWPEQFQFRAELSMKPRICLCCGEPLSDTANALSRNPNVCASCSSLADGMDEPKAPETNDLERAKVWLLEETAAHAATAENGKVLEPVLRR